MTSRAVLRGCGSALNSCSHQRSVLSYISLSWSLTTAFSDDVEHFAVVHSWRQALTEPHVAMSMLLSALEWTSLKVTGIRTSFSHTLDCGADILLVTVKIVSDYLELDLKSRRVFPANSMSFGWSSLKLVSVSECGRRNRVQHEVCWARLKVSHYCLNKVDSHLWEMLKA